MDDLVKALEALRLHVGPADLQVADRKVNSQLYISLANACLRNRAALLYGGMGANKTTLVNLLGSAFTGLSFDEVENRMITGHPEQTEEKIVGFIDPRQWSCPPASSSSSSRSSTRPGSSTYPESSSFDEGADAIEVLWTPWSRSRWKVINEINRFPAGKQNLFLELLQKRKVTYAGKTLDLGDTCYFATIPGSLSNSSEEKRGRDSASTQTSFSLSARARLARKSGWVAGTEIDIRSRRASSRG